MSVEVSAGTYWTGYKTILIKEVTRIVRIWPQTLIPPVITMSLYFVIFGSIIGRRVGEMGGIDYMEFIVPGLIMLSVITNSYGNITSSFFGAKFGRHIEELLISPLPPWIILAGYVSGALFRALGVGFLVWIVAGFFSGFHMHNVAVTLSILHDRHRVRTRRLHQCHLRAKIRRHCHHPHFRAAADDLPGRRVLLRRASARRLGAVALANPILYMVNALRYGMLGITDVSLGLAYFMIVLFGTVLFFICMNLLRRGTGLRS